MIEFLLPACAVFLAAVMEVGTRRIHRKLRAIDHAVNNVGPDEQPLIDKVRAVETTVGLHSAVLIDHGGKLDEILTILKPKEEQ